MKYCNLSIIIPHYNDNKNLTNLIKSIHSDKAFDKNDEIIIIDDNSKVTPNFKIKNLQVYKLKKNSGPSTARNIGIKKAKKKIIFFLDSDTELQQGSIKYIKNFYKVGKNKNIILNGCCSHVPIKKNIFTEYKALNENYWFKEMKKISKNQILNTRVGCIKRSILINEKIFFDEKIKNNFVEDYVFSKKLYKFYKFGSNKVSVKHDFPSFFKTLRLYLIRSIEWLKLFLSNNTKFNEGGGTSKKNALSAAYSFILILSIFFGLFLNAKILYVALISFLLFFNNNKELFLLVYKKKSLFYLLFFISYHLFLNFVILFGSIIGFLNFIFSKLKKFI